MRRSWSTGLAGLALCAWSIAARAESPAPPAASPPPVTPQVSAPAAAADAPAPASPPVSPYYAAPYGWPYVAAPYANPYPTPYVVAPGRAPSVYAAPPPRQTVEFPRARGSIATRWWFWAALGAAAVGIVVAGIALAPREPYSGNASPGIVTAF